VIDSSRGIIGTEELWNAYIGNKIDDNLKEIFSEIEQLIGVSPATTGYTTNVWK